jgi:hypothetical protein
LYERGVDRAIRGGVLSEQNDVARDWNEARSSHERGPGLVTGARQVVVERTHWSALKSNIRA